MKMSILYGIKKTVHVIHWLFEIQNDNMDTYLKEQIQFAES